MIVNRDELFKVVSKLRKGLVQGQVDAWHGMLRLAPGSGDKHQDMLGIRATVAGVEWCECIPTKIGAGRAWLKRCPTVSCEALYRTLKDKFELAADLRLTIEGEDLHIDHEANGNKWDKGITLPGAAPYLTAATTSTIQIDAGTLRGLFASVAHALSTDETRPHLTSVELTCENKTLCAVTIDGHRLATTTIPCGDLPDFEILLPGKGIEALVSALQRQDGEVEFSVSENAVVVEGPTCAVSMLRVDANFPPWRQVVPREDMGQQAEFETATLRRDLNAAPKDATCAVVTWEEAGIVVQFTTPAETASQPAVPTGEPITILYAPGASAPTRATYREYKAAYSLRYLRAALEALPRKSDTPRTTIQFDGELDPIVIRNGTAMFVIMPMRL